MSPYKIQVNHLYKIFGNRWQQALALIQQQKNQPEKNNQEIAAAIGCNVGLIDVTLNIEAGEIFVIMGLSGSGKSTLARQFNRLIEPSAGEILIDGVDVMTMSEPQLRDLRRHKISMVFQGFGLMPHKTVLDNAAFGLITRGEKKNIALQKASNWLEKVGLNGDENKYPDELSGGMRQRVGLARALATDTDIIIMDEAFSALDPLIRDDLQQQLLALQATLHKTIIFITHDLDEAFKLGNHIAILREGRVVQVGTAQEIVDNPVDDYVRRFVAKAKPAHA